MANATSKEVAKDAIGGKMTITTEGDGKSSSRHPVTLEVELQSDAVIRVSLCQGDMKVDLPSPKHIDIESDMPDLEGRTRATITFGNGELKWLGPEPVVRAGDRAAEKAAGD